MRFNLEDIGFADLVDVTPARTWGKGTPRERSLFRDTNYFYKIWGPDYLSSTVYSDHGSFHHHPEPLQLPHGFEVGLYSAANSSAFVGHIYSNEGSVRGYVTKAGEKKRISQEFAELVFEACVSVGWVYSDFCANNVTMVDGRLSLIDFDTHLSRIEGMSVAFEQTHGALRSHVDPYFRQLLLNHLPIEDL